MRADFERDGAVLVRDVVPRQTCERLHEAIEWCRDQPSEHYARLSEPGRAPVDSDLFRWFDNATIREVLFTSPLARLAATLLGDGGDVVLIEDQWFASAPGADTPSPWHQDEPYYNIDGDFVTLWLALDDAPAGAALSVVPGSHRWGRTFAPVAFVAGDADVVVDGADLERLSPEDVATTGQASWDVRAGDVIALHPLMLHSAGSQPVPDSWFRRLSTRWAAPTARYVDRGEQAAAFWRLLPHGLHTGDLLVSDTFPLVTPVAAGL